VPADPSSPPRRDALDPAAPLQFPGGACLLGRSQLAVRGPARHQVRLVSLESGRVSRVLDPPDVLSAKGVLRLHADRRGRILTGDYGQGRLVVWEVWRHEAPVGLVRTAAKGRVPNAWSPDSAVLATAGAADAVELWTKGEWDEPARTLRTFDPLHRVQTLGWAPGGEALGAALEDGTVVVWSGLAKPDLAPDPRIVVERVPERLPWCWAADGRGVLAVVTEGARDAPHAPSRLVRVAPGVAAETVAELPTAPKALAASGDGGSIVVQRSAAVGERGDLLERLDLADGAVRWSLPLEEGYDGRIWWHPGVDLLLLDGAHDVRFVDAATGDLAAAWVSLDDGADAAVWLRPGGRWFTNRPAWVHGAAPLEGWPPLVPPA
jgi:hypothetical protein